MWPGPNVLPSGIDIIELLVLAIKKGVHKSLEGRLSGELGPEIK